MIKNICILLASILAFSCASGPKEYKDLDRAVNTGNFEEAVQVIDRGQQRRRPVFSERNSILLYLNRGLLEHYAGNYEASSLSLQTAERLIEEAYTKSISQSFLSYIINDNTKEYPGEDFEDIYLNVFNALNYYNIGDLEGALVEIRKLTTSSGKLAMLARRHEYNDPNTGASLNEMTQRETGVSQLPETKSVNFSNSALARYLSFLFYQGMGNTDAARIEYNQIFQAFNTNRNIYNFNVPGAVEDAYNIPANKARLNVISFTGLSPIKEEERIVFYLPFHNPFLNAAVFRLPVLVRRPGLITNIEVIVNGTDRFYLQLLEDIGSVIEETYNARYGSIVAKTFIRTIIKHTAADIATIAAYREQDALTALFVAAGARTAANLSERADIRMSRYLPERSYIGGINLDPGTYSVIINYYNGVNLISTETYDNVIVEQNRLNLIQSVNLR